MLLMIKMFAENIHVLYKADSNDLQQWLSFKFNVPPLWSNAFNYSCEHILCDLFLKIHHDFSIGTGAIVWLHTDSEVAPKDICQMFRMLSPLQGLYSLSGKTSYHQISWSLEAARLDVARVVSFWDLPGIWAALLPKCLSNFRAIGKV